MAVTDEDLARVISVMLRELGWEVVEVRDSWLRGKSDRTVIEFARNSGAVLFSGDWGFANIREFQPRNYRGIVIIAFPNEIGASLVAEETRRALIKLGTLDFAQKLIIIEPGRIRIRRND